jgi:hypothetical protein
MGNQNGGADKEYRCVPLESEGLLGLNLIQIKILLNPGGRRIKPP